MMRTDWRAEPVQRLVVMGESDAFGNCAMEPQNEWVQVLAGLIRAFQGSDLRVFDNAIPSNVISPDAPAYPDKHGTKPSALERYRAHMLAFEPDLAVYAYGLPDARAACLSIFTADSKAHPGCCITIRCTSMIWASA